MIQEFEPRFVDDARLIHGWTRLFSLPILSLSSRLIILLCTFLKTIPSEISAAWLSLSSQRSRLSSWSTRLARGRWCMARISCQSACKCPFAPHCDVGWDFGINTYSWRSNEDRDLSKHNHHWCRWVWWHKEKEHSSANYGHEVVIVESRCKWRIGNSFYWENCTGIVKWLDDIVGEDCSTGSDW